MERGEGRTLVSRARDKDGNVQGNEEQWNLRGVCYSRWGESSGITVV